MNFLADEGIDKQIVAQAIYEYEKEPRHQDYRATYPDIAVLLGLYTGVPASAG
jgi:hypothetical protein